jgi:4-methylaminobutanoate oxidase (formaldehyde-forming)
MISKADAIVIGSGGLGAATAYYLSQRKGLSAVLIDKHDIGSQTSPRAAGMVSCARKSDLMISLIKDACRKIQAFTEETVATNFIVGRCTASAIASASRKSFFCPFE